MRVKTPEISWHNTTPVYSCDFQCAVNEVDDEAWIRLATCGRDNIIRIWRLPVSSCQPSFLTSLRRHDKPVNVVRFIPTGEDILASGADDGLVILWKRDSSASAAATASSRTLFGEDAEDEEKENAELWQVNRILRLHLEDVYDLSWSTNGQCLISGSVDHSAIEWNLKSGQQLLLKDHKQYVQGVAWDPRDEYVLSMGSDRSCRVYRVGSRNCSYNITRNDKQRLFQDDSWKSFFRRLSFSPDGALLVCPSGCYGMDGHCAYVFTRQSLPTPVLALPTESRPVVAVRFCPTSFCVPENCNPLFALPYVWVFCLVLEDGLLVYNTVSKYPIAYVGAIHYQALNDATWSKDGRLLVTSSTDGYCSVIQFDPYELGRPYSEKNSVTNVTSLGTANSKFCPSDKNVSNLPGDERVRNRNSVPSSSKENVLNNMQQASKEERGHRHLKDVQSSDQKDENSERKLNKSTVDVSKDSTVSNLKRASAETSESNIREKKETCNDRKSVNEKVASHSSSKIQQTPPKKTESSTIQRIKTTPEQTATRGGVQNVAAGADASNKTNLSKNDFEEPHVQQVVEEAAETNIPTVEQETVTPKKKRRVTLVTLTDTIGDNMEQAEVSVGVPADSEKTDESAVPVMNSPSEDVPRKRRVAITTISTEPSGPESSSPMQTMKRRVAFTTLTSQVTPEDVNDNLSNMSAPEFNLTLDDSFSECKKENVTERSHDENQ